jgi:hypothetical protein
LLSTLTAEDISALEKLHARLSFALSSSSSSSSSSFLRLCGRSPKDGEPLDRAAVWARYQSNLAEVKSELSSLRPPPSPEILESAGNTKLIAASRTPTLRVTSADEALALLLSSERVYSDLRDWASFGEPEQIVLRRFDQNVRLDWEFRAFVYKGALTAISQYDHYCVYPAIALHKDRIERAVRELWSEMHSSVGVESYCADFACIPDPDGDRYAPRASEREEDVRLREKRVAGGLSGGDPRERSEREEDVRLREKRVAGGLSGGDPPNPPCGRRASEASVKKMSACRRSGLQEVCRGETPEPPLLPAHMLGRTSARPDMCSAALVPARFRWPGSYSRTLFLCSHLSCSPSNPASRRAGTPPRWWRYHPSSRARARPCFIGTATPAS